MYTVRVPSGDPLPAPDHRVTRARHPPLDHHEPPIDGLRPRGGDAVEVVLTTDDRVRVLARMATVLEIRLAAFEQGLADPTELELTALLADDLDRHVTALADERYAPADDRYVVEIERTLLTVRSRLVEWSAA